MKRTRSDPWTLIGNNWSLLIVIGISGLLAAAPTTAQTVADSSAFGESVNVSLVPLLGVVPPLTSGPMPVVNGTASPAYDKSNTASSVGASSSPVGTSLQTGLLTVHVSSLMPAAVTTHADAITANPALGLGQLLPLLSLNAQVIQSASTIDGTCGSSLVASGSAGLIGATAGGAAGLGVAVPGNPAPNTVLINKLGIRIVLNEQFQTGNGTTNLSLTVNALHLYVQNSLLTGLGLLSGDIVISQSQAHVQCPIVTPRFADLAAAAAANQTSINVGQNVSVVFTVTNHGADPATSVVLTDGAIDRVMIDSITPSQGSCSTGDHVICNFGTLASGAQATVTLVLTALSAGTMLCEGAVASSVSDPDLSNNTASVAVQVVALPTQSPIDPGACRIDAVPAATLLIPYFEVDLDHFNGATTLISINNAKAAPRLAQITFWTDWGIPTLSYTIALPGFAVQTLNLRDVMGHGVLPGAAAGPGCASQALVAGALPATFMGHMQAWLTGRQSPLQGNCASPARVNNIATGYITVDAVNRCSTLNPSNPGYFVQGGQGVASDENVLWGDFFLVNGEENLAHGDPDVHILAEPGVFHNHYSFYSTFVGGSGADDRQPLGTSYASRYVSGGAFDGGTQLIVWRDAKVASPQALQCGQEPLRMRLGGTAYDEAGIGSAVVPSTQSAPWSTQKMTLGGSSFPLAQAFGWIHLDLWHSGGGLFGDVAQGWVTTIMSAQRRYSVGLRAIRLDSACDF